MRCLKIDQPPCQDGQDVQNFMVLTAPARSSYSWRRLRDSSKYGEFLSVAGWENNWQ